MILLTYWPWTKSSNLTGKYPHGARDAGRRPVLFLVVLQGSFTAGRTIFLRDQVRTCVLWPVVFLTRELDVKRRGNWFFIVFHWKVGPVRPFFLVIGPNSVSTSRAFFKSLMPLCDITYVLLDGPANQTLRLCEKQERKADSWQPWKSFDSNFWSPNLLNDNTKIQEDLRWVTLVLYIALIVQGTYYILLSWIKSTNFIPKLRENEGGLFAGYWTTSVSIELNQNQYIHIFYAII